MDPHVSQGSPRTGSTKVRDALSKPASPYLQEHLEARRGHPKRARRSDFGPRSSAFEDDLFVAEGQAPVKSPGRSQSTKSSTPGREKTGRAAQSAEMHKGLGARELDEHIDKLSKLNFDLKMELFHCRERMKKLQEQCDGLLERTEKAEDVARTTEQDRRTLLEINEEMVKELEKRDQAVQEAVTMICDLEEKVETLEQRPPGLSPESSPATNTGRYRRPVIQVPDSTHNGASGLPAPESAMSVQRRVPSFVCDKKSSTNALRSVYLEPASKLHAIKSYNSLLSLREELPDIDDLDSPRLSVLSESSFPSIYNAKQQPEPGDQQENQDAVNEQHSKRQSYDRYRIDNSRITEWVTNRIPSGQKQHFRHPSSDHQYQSLDNPVVYADLKEPFDEKSATRQPAAGQSPSGIQKQAQSAGSNLSPPIYGQDMLPPTPESMSTRLLRESQSSRSSFGAYSKHADTVTVSSATRMPNTSSHWRQSQKRLSSSEEGSEEEVDQHNADDASSTVRDLGDGLYDDWPNGGSIVTGTPSRFQVRHTSPPAKNLLFDGEGIEQVGSPRGESRNTGTETSTPSLNSTPRGNLHRCETSPTLPIASPRHGLSRSETSPSLTGAVAAASHGRRENVMDHVSVPDEPQQATPSPARRRLSGRFSGQRSQTKQQTPKGIGAATSLSQVSSGVRASFTQKKQKLFRRGSESGDSPKSDRLMPASTPGSSTTLSPGRKGSPRRPRTAYPVDTPTNAQKLGEFLPQPDRESRRPASQDSDLARVAANQALASTARRQSLQSQQNPMHMSKQQQQQPLSPPPPTRSSSRGFFKRAGSVRR